ncbi:hypothetical protein TRIP_C21454 [Candidatus Zixiibacteriota bacterium]|nr:hypothetical protein TRIP_C21454 [candidate division Zixibacteria bacterium]
MKMSRKLLIWPSVILVIMIIFWGCKKRTFTVESTYAEEMQRFIVDSDDGRELYRQDIFSDRPFYAYYDSLHLYFYSIDSSHRRIRINIGSHVTDVYPYESIYNALGTVWDVYYGHLNRIDGADTVPAYILVDTLIRYAYFLKLYDDSYDYHGWRFWGFIGGKYNPVASQGGRVFGTAGNVSWPATPPGIPPVPGDSGGYYINDDFIPKFSLADSLTLLTNIPDIIFVEKGDSGVAPIKAATYSTRFRAGWRLPSQTTELYHLIFFDIPGRFKVDTLQDNSVESTLIKTYDYIIPFKADI